MPRGNEMQAVILGLLMPVIPLLIRKLYVKTTEESVVGLLGRYAVYTLVTSVISNFFMIFLCDENTSFMEKMDKSPTFVFKYTLITAIAVSIILVADWMLTTRKLAVKVDWAQYESTGIVKFFRKRICPIGLYLLAILVAIMNFGLMFDNVLWGDEAYAAGLIRNDVSGIFQVLTLEENHPPLYYLWLKMFAELLGYEGWVYHFASYVPFIIGLIMAITLFRKRFGNLPATFFVLLSGMSAPCLEYNMEVRMYALAFLGIAGAFYCAYRILCGGKAAPWIGIVFWSLVAAYSHYYALVSAGILMVLCFGAAIIRFRTEKDAKGKSPKIWLKSLLSLLVFVAAYMPWLAQLFRATESVSGNWWMTEIETLGQCFEMIGCGVNMSKIVLLVMLVLAVVLFLAESAFLCMEKIQGKLVDEKDGGMKSGEEKVTKEKYILQIRVPSVKNWSEHTWTIAVGLLTIAGTVVFAYGISIFMTPLLTGRYLYPLCAITALILVIGSSKVLELLKACQEKFKKNWPVVAGKVVFFLVLAVLFVKGVQDYNTYKAVVEKESILTQETLELIGEPTEGMEFVNNGVQHIGWTVLQYYYPDAEVQNGGPDQAETDEYWYFTTEYMSTEDVSRLMAEGYEVAGYGEHQIAKYPCVIYHIKKSEVPVVPVVN